MYYLKVKFPMPVGLGVLKGNQYQACQCYALALRGKDHPVSLVLMLQSHSSISNGCLPPISGSLNPEPQSFGSTDLEPQTFGSPDPEPQVFSLISSERTSFLPYAHVPTAITRPVGETFLADMCPDKWKALILGSLYHIFLPQLVFQGEGVLLCPPP